MEKIFNLQFSNYVDVFENSSDYVFIKSTEKKYPYIYGNYKFRSISGIHRQDNLLNMSDEDMPWSTYCEDYRQHDHDTLLGLKYLQLEITEGCNGVRTSVISRKYPLYDYSGKTVAIICFAQYAKKNLIHLSDELLYYDGKPLKISNYLQDHLQQHRHKDLTSRESECLFYLLRGRTPKEIANKLFVSPKTVYFHIENIKKKWNCHSRSDIFDKAYEYECFNVIPPDIFSEINGVNIKKRE